MDHYYSPTDSRIVPKSFLDRLKSPAVYQDFETEAAMLDYAETLLHLPLDGEPVGRYYKQASPTFTIESTPFPTLADLGVTPTPGSLFYTPRPRAELCIQILPQRTSSCYEDDGSMLPCRRYHRSRSRAGESQTGWVKLPITREQLQTAYLPVPAKSVQLEVAENNRDENRVVPGTRAGGPAPH